MNKLLSLLLVLALTFSLCACGTPDSKNDDTQNATTDAATIEQQSTDSIQEPVTDDHSNASGEVNVYLAATEDFAIAIKENFEKAYPNITMNYVLLGGGEILARMRAEADNPLADCVVGGSCDGLMIAKNENLLLPYVSPNTADWDARYLDPDGYWTGYIRGFLGFYCDQDWFAEHDMELPTSWNDLLDERLDDNVVMTNPGTSSTGFMFLSAMCQLLGEEEAFNYMTELDNNIKSYAKSGSGPSNSVALGEASVGIGYIQFGIQLAEQGYSNLVISMPEEGTAEEIASMAIINNCKNPDAAKCLMDYLSSVEGQELCNTCGYHMYQCHPDAQPSEQAQAYKDTKTIALDFDWSAENRDRLVEEWDARISNK